MVSPRRLVENFDRLKRKAQLRIARKEVGKRARDADDETLLQLCREKLADSARKRH